VHLHGAVHHLRQARSDRSERFESPRTIKIGGGANFRSQKNVFFS
jgi:hypothetical protein